MLTGSLLGFIQKLANEKLYTLGLKSIHYSCNTHTGFPIIPSNGTSTQCALEVFFPLIDHSLSSVRILLEQNKFSKKLPLTGIEPSNLGMSTHQLFES